MTFRFSPATRIARLVIALVFSVSALALDVDREDVSRFIARMHAEHGFDAGYVREVLADAQRQESILEAISRPAEKSKPWHEYRKIFLNDQRIDAGVAFWQQHAQALDAVARDSGVPAEIIVAIIGVETHYGRLTGSYRVVDALSTLGFDYPPRGPFFLSELENFFLLSREEDIRIDTAKGSYAGAMGAAQFIPSSYRRYAMDGDADGQRNLWTNWNDVFASVANYFVVHGWQRGAPAVTPAQVSEAVAEPLATTDLAPTYRIGFLRRYGVAFETSLPDTDGASLIPFDGADGPEYWVGFDNFYVVTRYNRSRMYALAVLQLADELRAQVSG